MSAAARLEGIRIREREVSEHSERTGATAVRIPSRMLSRAIRERQPFGAQRNSNQGGRAQRSEHVRPWFESLPPHTCGSRTVREPRAPGSFAPVYAFRGGSLVGVSPGSPATEPGRTCPHSRTAPLRTSRLPSLVGRPPPRSGRPTPSRASVAAAGRSRARADRFSSAKDSRRTPARASLRRRLGPPVPPRSCTRAGSPRRRTPAGRPCRRRPC